MEVKLPSFYYNQRVRSPTSVFKQSPNDSRFERQTSVIDDKATQELVDEITKPEVVVHEIKPENRLEPVSLTRRSLDRGL